MGRLLCGVNGCQDLIGDGGKFKALISVQAGASGLNFDGFFNFSFCEEGLCR